MTKYILHGGMVIHQTPQNKQYYQEMLVGLTKPKILLVYFAREKEEYEYLKNRDQSHFKWANPGKEFELEIASADRFADQVKSSDVLAIAGGSSKKLMSEINKTRDELAKLFEGKVIGGSSAGAHMISEWFYSHSADKLEQGLGLLPISVLTHYQAKKGTEFWKPKNEWDEIEKKLQQICGADKITKLHEQESIVITKP